MIHVVNKICFNIGEYLDTKLFKKIRNNVIGEMTVNEIILKILK